MMASPHYNSRPARLEDSRKLARLHYLSHTQSFQSFAARVWTTGRRFGEYLDFWNSFLPDLSSRETTWTVWRKNRLVGTVTLKELQNSSPIFCPRDLRGRSLEQVCCLRLMYVHPDYLDKYPAAMLQDPHIIHKADLDQIKTMLTYCVRGERFYDGYWAAVIRKGVVQRLLERLDVILDNL